MKRHIILEGPDHVGKTTAANWLRENMRYRVAHMGIPCEGWDYLHDYMDRIPNRGADPVVLDRFHLGALVYGRFMKLHDTQGWCWEFLGSVMQAIRFEGIRVVIMYTSHLSWLDHELEQNGKTEAFKRDEILRVNELYEGLTKMQLNGMPFCQTAYDVRDGKYPTEEEISSWATRPLGL